MPALFDRPRLRKSLSLAALAAALAACGTLYLQVPHPAPPDKIPLSESGRVSRIYLVLQRPASYDADESALSQVFGLVAAFAGSSDRNHYTADWTPERLDEFARRVSAALNGPACQVVGWQVVYSTAAPDWLADFSATGRLLIQVPDLSVSQDEYEETVSGEKGAARTVKKYKLRADFSPRWKFYSEPEHAPLGEGSYDGTSVSEERDDKVTDLKAWLEPKFWEAALGFTGPLHPALFPHQVSLDRSIKKGDGAPAAAFDQASQGHWDEAAKLWQACADSNPKDWISHLNLGVWHERAGRWAEARKEYQLALALGPDASGKAHAESWLADLDRIPLPPPAPANARAASFYDMRLAVLPFANESVDLGAPDYTRLAVMDSLHERGYALLSQPDVDAGLLQKGIREGGQLDLLQPAQIASLLGADRVLYGAVEEYGVVNVGVYYRRKVRLALKLFDRDGKLLWSNTGQTLLQSGVKPKEAAEAFLSHTADGLVSKIKKTYLKDEADQAVARSLETLPRSVNQKKE